MRFMKYDNGMDSSLHIDREKIGIMEIQSHFGIPAKPVLERFECGELLAGELKPDTSYSSDRLAK